MSEPAVETPPAPRKSRPNAGKFAVLKQINSIEELSELLATGEVEIFAVLQRDVPARTAPKAIESIAVTDEDVKVGRYVGVPMASFQPRNVRQVVHMTLE